MRWNRLKRQISAGVAVWSLLLMALAPLLAQALQPADAARWIEVCSATGTQRLSGQGALDAPLTDAFHAADHCPWCSWQAHGVGLPPAAFAFAAPALHFSQPGVVRALPPSRSAWRTAQARAPPAQA